MKYNFAEKNLGSDFYKDVVDQLKRVIQAGSSCTLVGMPFIGLVPFCRYLATRNFAYFILIDVHSLASPRKSDLFFTLYKELGGTEQTIENNNLIMRCKEQIDIVLKKEKKIVIIINQINLLTNELGNRLLLNLRTLEDYAKGKVFFIVSATKPLYEYPSITNYEKSFGFASKIIYFPPYKKSDLKTSTSLPIQLESKTK